MIRPLLTILALVTVLSSMGCLANGFQEQPIDSTVSTDTIKPMSPSDPTADQSNETVSCTGINPPEGIQEMHHQQCEEWGISNCTITNDECQTVFEQSQSSTCCCILCGREQGNARCFNVKCP